MFYTHEINIDSRSLLARSSLQAMTGAGNKNQTRLFLGLFVTVMVFCCVLSFFHQKALFDNMRVGGRDLAFFTQSLWNAAQGNGLRTTIGFRGDHLFSEHFYLTHWIWVLPYKLFSSPYLLFAVQALSLSATGLAAFRLAVSYSLDVRIAALLSSAVLLQPTLHGAASGINFYGYHPDTLFPALFLFALCALRSGRMIWFWVLAFAAMATLEQAALVLGPLGVYMAFTKRVRSGIALCCISAAWFVGSTGFVVPMFSDGRTAYYFKALKLFSDIELFRFAVMEVLEYMAQFMILFAGLPLLSAASLIALPIILVYAQAISVGYTVPLGILSWHADLVLPVLVLGSVSTLSWLQRKHSIKLTWILTLGAVWCLSLSVITYTFVYSGWSKERERPELNALHLMQGMVPDDASLSASFFVTPHFSHRENLWIFPKLKDAEYILVNNDKRYKYTNKEEEVFDELLGDDGYEVLFNESGFTLFRKQAIDSMSGS